MPSARDRLTGLPRRFRLRVLRHRRLLAAALAALAVAAGLQAVVAPTPPGVRVAVAARDLPGGTVLTERDLTEVSFSEGSVPDGLAGETTGRTLAAPLRRGEPVTDLRLVGPGLAAGHPGLTAVPIRLPDPAMAALLTVGDHIDLVAADPQGTAAQVIARGVPVLALPSEQPGAQGSLSGRLIVVGATEAVALDLAAAQVASFLSVSISR